MKFYHRVLHFFITILKFDALLIGYMSRFKKKGINISKVNCVVF